MFRTIHVLALIVISACAASADPAEQSFADTFDTKVRTAEIEQLRADNERLKQELGGRLTEVGRLLESNAKLADGTYEAKLLRLYVINDLKLRGRKIDELVFCTPNMGEPYLAKSEEECLEKHGPESSVHLPLKYNAAGEPQFVSDLYY